MLYLNIGGTILCFANGTAVLYEVNTWENMIIKVENDFLTIEKLFRRNTLTLNVEKTKSSYSSNLPNMGPLEINPSLNIPESETIKSLGVIVDKNMK